MAVAAMPPKLLFAKSRPRPESDSRPHVENRTVRTQEVDHEAVEDFRALPRRLRADAGKGHTTRRAFERRGASSSQAASIGQRRRSSATLQHATPRAPRTRGCAVACVATPPFVRLLLSISRHSAIPCPSMARYSGPSSFRYAGKRANSPSQRISPTIPACPTSAVHSTDGPSPDAVPLGRS
jgi:hypothetical protein